MSARDVIAEAIADCPMEDDCETQADAILTALHSMPLAARLAHAREMAGPDWAVVPKEATHSMALVGTREVVGAERYARDHEYCDTTTLPRVLVAWTSMLAAAEKEMQG